MRSRKRIGGEFPRVPGVIPAVAFSPSGRLLISDLGAATLWDIDPARVRRFACQVAGREITREEWADLLPGRPYRPVCA